MMMRLLALLAMWLALGAQQAAPPAPIRIALVIGNSRYDALPKLANAANDARIIGSALGQAGFTVAEVIDKPRTEMIGKIEEFREAIKRLPKEGMAVVYYAGHGFEINGGNVIAPIDTAIEQSSSPRGIMPVSDIIDIARDNPSASLVFMIDACRSLVGTRLEAVTQPGFSQQPVPPNAFVVYASQRGSSAADGAPGESSPFARAVLHELTQPSEPIALFFPNVAKRVFKDYTHESQQPMMIPSYEGQRAISQQPIKPGDLHLYQGQLAHEAGNWDAAKSLFGQALTEGKSDAAIEVAHMALYHSGKSPDFAAAIQAYDRMIALKDPRGYRMKGYLLAFDMPKEQQDYKAAAQLFESGIKAKDSTSAYWLAYLKTNEEYGMIDGPGAVKLYNQALDAENCCGAVNLGVIYAYGMKGVEKNLPKAKELWVLAGTRGNARAWNNLGRLALEEGRGEEARQYFERGASAGFLQSYLKLIDMYASGTLIPVDLVKARRAYQMVIVKATEAEDKDIIERALTMGKFYKLTDA